MIYKAIHLKGRGRARKLGFPTVNLKIPDNFSLDHGVYGAFFIVEDKKFTSAMHYGPSPTFSDRKVTLELYLIDFRDKILPDFTGKKISFEVIKKIRGVLKFKSEAELIRQIKEDVENIKKLT